MSGTSTPSSDADIPTDGEEQVPSTSAPGGSPRLRWSSLSDGLIIGFLLSGTTVFAALILRAQHEHAWKDLLLVAAVGFVVSGAVAGRHRRSRKGAMTQGCAVGFLLATAAILAAALRYLALGTSVSSNTWKVWVGIEVAAVIVSTLGALLGRRMYLRSRRRKAKTA
jgi:hypothetical protein